MVSRGTIRWLAPELLQSDPPCAASALSDIYGFACVCCEIFTGSVPFHGLCRWCSYYHCGC
ncbi:hypothetical protein L218DRAFT_887453 [Marasmius fiardii PR-910]|nr:hypothetical protein L218DRAFT_887453 [Marasmius fiardii PR-910]